MLGLAPLAALSSLFSALPTLTLFFVLLLAGSFCAEADEHLTLAEQEWLNNNQVVVVGVQTDWKPFDFSDPDDHSPQGIVQDLITEITRASGITPAYRIADWHTLFSEFQQGHIDVLPAIRHTREREQEALFTDPYLNLYQYFFAHTDSIPGLKADFHGARLAIPLSYASAEMASRQYPGMELVFVNTVEDAINLVMSREADLLLDIYSSLNYQLKEMGVQLIQPYRPFETLELRMAVRKSSPMLASVLQKTLDHIPDSYIQQLNEQWLPVTPTSGFVPLAHYELSWLRKHPQVTFSSEIDWLPLAHVQEDTIQGIAGDVIRHMSNRLNIRFHHNSQSTPPQVLLVDTEADAVPDAYRIVANLGQYPLVLITNQSTPFINYLDELEDITIATVKGASYLKTLKRRYPNHTIETLEDGSDVLLALQEGQYEAALLPAAAASYLMQLSEFQQLSISGITDITVDAALLVHMDSPVLADTLSRTYDRMTEAEKASITNAWGKLSLATNINYAPFIQLILVIVVIAGLIIYWNRKLSREIRHRKAIEISVRQERDNFQALFQQAIEGNLIFQENRCIEANQAALALFGRPAKASIKHCNVTDLLCPDSWNEVLYTKVRSAFTTCTSRGHSQLEFWIRSPDNHDKVWIDASLTLIHYLKKPSIYMVCRDISAQKRLEMDLSNARQAAEAGNQAKSDFIARVSHEIRTPLNIIIGSTRLLQENSNNQDLVLEKSNSIQRAGERLLLQIEDVLNFSRLEADEMPLYEEPLNLAEVVAENADFFCDMASKKYLVLECHADPELEQLRLMMDLSRLNQILANLITNAIKYTKEGKITLRAGIAHTERSLGKADIYIAVQDTGVGIASNEQKDIFENFVRTSNSENLQQEGTGLGLAISSKLAELMGGHLDLVSQLGEGSTFTLRLRAVHICTDTENQGRSSLSRRDRQTLKRARKPIQTQTTGALENTEVNGRVRLPAWFHGLTDNESRNFEREFKLKISPLLNQLTQHQGLTQTRELARALQTHSNTNLNRMGDQLKEACRICDIAAIEQHRKQLIRIEKVIQDT